MVETVLKSSHLLETLINDVLELSRLEDGSLELDNEVFNLHGVFREVISLVKPVSSVKKIALTLILSPGLPVFAVGDEKRIMQTFLNILGNAVRFTKEGYVTAVTSVAKPESLRDWRVPEFHPISIDGHFYLRVQGNKVCLELDQIKESEMISDKVDVTFSAFLQSSLHIMHSLFGWCLAAVSKQFDFQPAPRCFTLGIRPVKFLSRVYQKNKFSFPVNQQHEIIVVDNEHSERETHLRCLSSFLQNI